jgi:phage tail tape-measure protein
MAAGRVLGGAIGAFFGGPVGIALFSTLGGVVGQVVGDKLFGDKVKDTAASANDEIYSANMKQADDTAKLNSQVSELIDQQRAANSINVQALAYQRDTSRGIRNLPLPS